MSSIYELTSHQSAGFILAAAYQSPAPQVKTRSQPMSFNALAYHFEQPMSFNALAYHFEQAYVF